MHILSVFSGMLLFPSQKRENSTSFLIDQMLISHQHKYRYDIRPDITDIRTLSIESVSFSILS